MNYLTKDEVICECPARHHRFTVFSSLWAAEEDHWLALTFEDKIKAEDYADTFAIHSSPATIKVFCKFHIDNGKEERND